MMGCGSSMETTSISENQQVSGIQQWQLNGQNNMNIVEQFVRFDEQITKLEANCPGPRMATIQAWVEHLETRRNSLIGGHNVQHSPKHNGKHQITQQELNAIAVSNIEKHQNTLAANSNGISNGLGVSRTSFNKNLTTTPGQDLAKMALSLGVVNDKQKASTHEDFFANLSDQAMHLLTLRYYTEILEHNKVRLKTLTDNYGELNSLYLNLDGIIAFISGGTYMSRREENIDGQLETARDVRDKLGSASEQWRICGTLLRACANTASQAIQQWKRLPNIQNTREKVHSALECRNALHASLISLDCAQLSLPHVEIKFISNRQILAVQHCSIYMITDIVNSSRYDHSSKVFTTYEENIKKATSWLHDTYKKTLRADLEKSQDTVQSLAKRLRDHREEIFMGAQK